MSGRKITMEAPWGSTESSETLTPRFGLSTIQSLNLDTPSSSGIASSKSKKPSKSTCAPRKPKKSSKSVGALRTSSRSSSLMGAPKKSRKSPSSMGAPKKSRKSPSSSSSSSSIGAPKKSKKAPAPSSSMDAPRKSTKSPTSSSSESSILTASWHTNRHECEWRNGDDDSEEWRTVGPTTLVFDAPELPAEQMIVENLEYRTQSPESIRERLPSVSDIYNPNESLLRIDRNLGVSESPKKRRVDGVHRLEKPSTIPELTEVASVEADLSDASSNESLHVLRDANKKKYLAPTEDETWNERCSDTRKKISPRRQKNRKWTLEAIFGKPRLLHPKPENITFREERLRRANDLWDEFIAKEPINAGASCSTAPKSKFFKKKSGVVAEVKSKRVDDLWGSPPRGSQSSFRRDSPTPPGVWRIRGRLLNPDPDSESDGEIIGLSEYRLRKRRRAAIGAVEAERTRRDSPAPPSASCIREKSLNPDPDTESDGVFNVAEYRLRKRRRAAVAAVDPQRTRRDSPAPPSASCIREKSFNPDPGSESDGEFNVAEYRLRKRRRAAVAAVEPERRRRRISSSEQES